MDESHRIESYIELFDIFKWIELDKELVLKVSGTIGGACYIFWFEKQHRTDDIRSDYIAWWYQKESAYEFLDRLNKLAEDFRTSLKKGL